MIRRTQDARAFIADASFIWHQRFELGDGAYTAGVSDVDWLYEIAQIPRDLDGHSVLDIGTTNGEAAFEAERRAPVGSSRSTCSLLAQ